jgi:prophage regulatory protein
MDLEHRQIYCLIRPTEQRRRAGLAKTQYYALLKSGLLPSNVRIGPRSVAVPETEFQAVLEARVAGRTEGEIRALVACLHAARATSNRRSGAE